MKKNLMMTAVVALTMQTTTQAQSPLTPEKLWELGRVSAETLTPDGKYVIYGVSKFDLAANSSERNLYRVPVTGGQAEQITFTKGGENVLFFHPSGKQMVYLHAGQLWRLDFDSRESRQLTHV